MALAQKDLLLPPLSPLLELYVEPTVLRFFYRRQFYVLVVFPFDFCLLLPLCAESIAFCCSFSGSMVQSDFTKRVLPVVVILLRIRSNFLSFTDEDFTIHVFSNLTIFNNWGRIGSSSGMLILMIC